MKINRCSRFAIVASLLMMAGCANQPASTTTPPPPMTSLQKIATGLDALQKSLGVFQTAVIQGNQDKIISDAATKEIIGVCSQIATAGLQANSIVRTATTLDGPTASKLIALIGPVSNSVGALLNKYPTAQWGIQTALLTLQTALSTIQLAAAGGA